MVWYWWLMKINGLENSINTNFCYKQLKLYNIVVKNHSEQSDISVYVFYKVLLKRLLLQLDKPPVYWLNFAEHHHTLCYYHWNTVLYSANFFASLYFCFHYSLFLFSSLLQKKNWYIVQYFPVLVQTVEWLAQVSSSFRNSNSIWSAFMLKYELFPHIVCILLTNARCLPQGLFSQKLCSRFFSFSLLFVIHISVPSCAGLCAWVLNIPFLCSGSDFHCGDKGFQAESNWLLLTP